MLENSTILSGSDPDFPGQPIAIPFGGGPVTIHQAPTQNIDRCVLTIEYPSTGTTTATMTVEVAGAEAVNIKMPPGSVYTLDVGFGSSAANPALLLTVEMNGGDEDGRVSGYVIRGGRGVVLGRS
jgi:hypothetical protein